MVLNSGLRKAQRLFFNTLLILIFVTAPSSGKDTTPDSVKSRLKGFFKANTTYGLQYETGYMWDRIFHPREFREPINIVPLEIRYGLGFNGGDGKFFKDTKSDWIKYENTVTDDFDGGSVSARIGHQLEIDFLKTNLSYYLFKTSWADIHTGLNFRYSSLFLPAEIPTASWKETNPSWDVGKKEFSPRLIEFGISNSVNLQWFEPWFINLRYTYGIATGKFYRKDKIYDDVPNGWGPSVSYGVGIRYILDPGMESRFTVGLDFKHSYTKIDRISDPDNLTPISQFDLSNFGLFLTLSAFYGGEKTIGDTGKEYYYHRNYVTAKEKLEEFVVQYPNHANRYRAERLIAECQKKIPIQLMKEGMSFDKRKLTGKALDRYIQARELARDSILIAGLDERIDQIARNNMYTAEQLLADGQSRSALNLVLKTASVSSRAREALPRFRAQVTKAEGKQAMDYGFYAKAIRLFDKAVQQDPDLLIEVDLLRYQLATLLVDQANRIEDMEAIRLAIHSLEMASEITRTIGKRNQEMLAALKAKLAEYDEAVIRQRIDRRMARERALMEKRSRPPVQVGMTIPEVQALLGEPEEIVHKTSNQGEDLQLWLYPLKDGKTLQLSFQEFILFKIEKE